MLGRGKSSEEVDICLILEGTFPFVTGGVSQWTYDLILSHPDKRFCLMCLLPPNITPKEKYPIPDNVVEIHRLTIQDLPKRRSRLTAKEEEDLFLQMENALLLLQKKPSLTSLKKACDLFRENELKIGRSLLLNSKSAWKMIVRMYRIMSGEGSFLNFFWSWQSLIAGFYSILMAPIPKAKVYHSLCTGYAGLFLARISTETSRPCCVTEHGIYTNERRIEVTAAAWLKDQFEEIRDVEEKNYFSTLRDFWIDTFSGYSRLCYEAADKVITLYDGNRWMQEIDGASPDKTLVIPNGVHLEKYASIKRECQEIPVVAIIGRVVPIKDIKTFIRSMAILKERKIPFQAWIIGPTDEDEEYAKECALLVKECEMEDTITFQGKVDVSDFLGKIDVITLTSVSEAQPLTVLEAGALGIPCVVTNVGSCSEIVFGRNEENPSLGQAGIVSPLADPHVFAENVETLLTNKPLYEECSRVIQERVKRYYDINLQQSAYDKIYKELLMRSQEKAWQG